MANTTQLTFYIYLTDQDRVSALQAQYPAGVVRGPLPAATEFGAPYIADGDPISYPCTRTGWLPDGGSGKFPLDRAFFTLSDSFWGHLFGQTKKYVWVGQFRYQAPSDQVATGGTGNTFPMRQVAWAQGWEISPNGSAGAEGSSSASSFITRDASRTVEGYGFAMRGAVSVEQRTWNTLGGVVLANRAWERFYCRVRSMPTADVGLWKIRMDSALNNGGAAITINSSGQLAVRPVSNVGGLMSGVIQSTTNLVLNEWTLIDVVVACGDEDTGVEPSSENAVTQIKVYVNHVLIIDTKLSMSPSTDPETYVLNFSSLGIIAVSDGAANLEIDYDDWIGFVLPIDTARPPTNPIFQTGPTVGPGADFIHGHHVAYVEPYAFDATHSANWTGGVRGLSQHAAGASVTEDNILTSSTASALIAVTTKLPLIAAQDGVLGLQALTVQMLSRRATSGNGQLGFNLNGAGAVMTTITQAATDTWNFALYNPSGQVAPIPVTSLLLRYTKAADANLTTVRALSATAVLVGTWDNCDKWPQPGADDSETMRSPASFGIHNAPYPRTPWNRSDVPPDSPVWVKSGSYTGNDLGQDIIAKIPAHFWWVRGTSANVPGSRWWSSMLQPRIGLTGAHAPITAQEDPEFAAAGGAGNPESRSLVRIGGKASNYNANTATYEYVAVGDPGQRFMLNGAFRHFSSVVSAVNALVDSGFTPEAMFAAREDPTTNFTTYYKGPGHALTNGQALDAGEVATFGSFAAGSFTSLSTLHPGTPSISFSMWRQRDGADYAGYGVTEPVVVQLTSYTGDGSASRTINLPRTSGKRPLWGMVVGHTGTTFVRDPAHLTNTSSTPANGNATSTTGITGGGVDQISVGSSLNTNAVVYEVFVIMAADATAGNGGWGVDGEWITDPIPASGSQWGDGYTQDELDDIENGDTGSTIDSFDDGPDLTDDLGDALCVPYVLRAVNLAFTRLGISQRVTAASELLTPTRPECDMAAAMYEHCLRATLRDFPWAHATRYARLTLVDGSEDDPVNGDWIYKFRMPTGYLFARRLVPAETDGRKFNQTPIAYRIVEDETGPALFCNDVREDDDGTLFVELEYTVRPACGSKAAGDQLFVSTFAHRLAMEIGPPLARDEKLVDRSAKAYEAQRNVATTSNVRESQQEDEGDATWIQER